MRKGNLHAILAIVLIVIIPVLSAAETRLFVPQFRHSSGEDTQLLFANSNDHDVTLDLWAFTGAGRWLGQVQLSIGANATRSVTMGEAFGVAGETVNGWVGAVSTDDGLQLSYSWVGSTVESFEAETAAARGIDLSVRAAAGDVIRISNPNAVAANAVVTGRDLSGGYVGVREVTVDPFSQRELAVSSLFEGPASRLEIAANVDILAGVGQATELNGDVASSNGDAPDAAPMDLQIQTEAALGAYQVTLRFDPETVTFSPKDVTGGSAEGFESQPLVVRIDNVAGEMTIGSFQVGGSPSGQLVVARLTVSAANGMAPRFDLQIDEVTDLEGSSLVGSHLAVGLVPGR